MSSRHLYLHWTRPNAKYYKIWEPFADVQFLRKLAPCVRHSQQQLANPETQVEFSLIPNGIVEENCEIAQA